MSSDFEQEQALFARCLEHPQTEWEDVLREGSDDPSLRQRVRRLLDHHRNPPTDGSAFLRLNGSDPERVGPYRVLQRLGKGGMGVVYAAEQREPVRRRVAIKILRDGFASREVLARFDVERQALALMNHPNIARILDAGTTADHRPFIAMEFVPGETITAYCERQALPLDRRLALFCQVCDAVQHAHQKGVIHRDIKPSNILVAEENGRPVPKIIDFGIAKAVAQRLTDHTLETKIGSLLGTPDYMSPEQIDLSPLDVDTRADVYALGAVLHELLCGTPPFNLHGANHGFAEIQRIVRETEPPPPSARASGSAAKAIRGELDWIVQRALEKERSRRYGSAAELRDDVQRYLSHEATRAGPPSRLRHVKKFVQRHRFASVTATLAAIAVAALAAGMSVQAQWLATERDRANREADLAAQTTRLLLDIFRGSDPRLWHENPPTITEVLDNGVDAIMSDDSIATEVRVRLLTDVSGVLGSIGKTARGIELLETAWRELETANETQTPLAMKVLAETGRSYASLQRRDDALSVLHRARALGDALKLQDSEHYLDVLSSLALLEIDTQPDATLEQLASLLPRFEALHGPKSRQVIGLRSNIATAQKRTGNLDAARDEYEALLPIAIETLGRKNSAVAIILINLGNTAMRLQDLEQAERYHREGVALARELFGEDSMITQSAIVSLALSARDIDEGIALMEQSLAKHGELLGEDSMAYAITRSNLAWILAKRPENFARAESIYEESLALFREHLGETHRYTVSSALGLANIYARSGREARAVSLAGPALSDAEARRLLLDDPAFEPLRSLPAIRARLDESQAAVPP